jgi:hypothetical protein
MKKLLLFLTCALFLAAGALAQATTWHVDAGYEGGDSDGTAGKPYVFIQDAIDGAAAGDEILVEPGSYPERLIISKSIAITGKVDGGSRAVVSPPIDVAKSSYSELIWIVGGLRKVIDPDPIVSISGLEIDGMNQEGIFAGIVSGYFHLHLEDVIIHSILHEVDPNDKYSPASLYGINITSGKLIVNDCRIFDIRGIYGQNVPYKSLKKESAHAVGIYADDLGGLSVTGTEIHDIVFEFGDASGISVHKPYYDEDRKFDNKTDVRSDFEISGNEIHGIRGDYYAAGISPKKRPVC